MNDDRPDPDQLLNKINEEAQLATRGKLRIFLGASAGVGKTYAMLISARQQVSQGTDIVVGIVETHGRKETAELLNGLELLPQKSISYRNKLLPEFDIDGALSRKPNLILIDELAHSNIPGSRHPKRWQDVAELIATGINVYSTLNIQHLESLNDVVGSITGIRVWETIPDHVFDQADEVVIVDLPPDELLQRLKEGKVYLPHQAENAIKNFFRKGNLIALRELALRRVADRVDDQMVKYRQDQAVAPVWQTRESLLAAISPHGDERIIRSAARLAARLEVPWHVIHIETPELQRLTLERRQKILKSLRLAQEMGAETAIISGVNAVNTLVDYARKHNLAKIIVGRTHRSAWWPWSHSFAELIALNAPDLDIIQVAHEEKQNIPDVKSNQLFCFDWIKAPWQSYLMSIAICGITTLIVAPLYSIFAPTNIVMLFLLAVIFISVHYGSGPSILGSLLNVLAFDFFFIEPRFSLTINDIQYVITFAGLIIVSLIITKLTNGLKYQALVAINREQRIQALYEISRELSGVLLVEQVNNISQRFSVAEFNAQSLLLLADENDHLLEPTPKSINYDIGIAQWAFDHSSAAGYGTDTLPGNPILYIPLKAPMRTRGVLALAARNPIHLMTPEQRRMLDTFARLLAISLERIHYVEVAQATILRMEAERLRNSLLAKNSHSDIYY